MEDKFSNMFQNMNPLESEIRAEFARMNQPLSQKSVNFTFGNTAETWESLSQYGYAMAYYPTQKEAEYHTIAFYKSHMSLIRQ